MDADKGYQLPTVVSPTEYWCYPILIPKDIAYLRAVRGALGTLCYYWSWQADVDNTRDAVVQKMLAMTLLADTTLTDSGGNCLIDCQDILDCINTTESLQGAIAYYSAGSAINGATAENATILASLLVDNQAGCNNNNIYGMVLQLVNFIDELNKDVFEKLIAGTQSMDALAYLISAIPAVESLPLDEALSFTNWLLDTMYTSYLSASTVVLRTQVACDLLCLASANGCTLNLAQARDYFYDALGLTLDTSNPTLFLEDLIVNNLTGDATFYGMYTLVFQLLAFGGAVGGIYATRLIRLVQSMFNDPNPDWSTDCDTCPDVWTWDSDFATAENIWEVYPSAYGARATYNVGTGYVSRDVQTQASPLRYMRGCQIRTIAFTPTTISQVTMTYDLTKGASWVDPTTAEMGVVCVKNSGAQVAQYLLYADAVDGVDQTLTLDLADTDIKQIIVWSRSSNASAPSYSGYCKVKSVRVQGENFNPFM